ncbi:MAG: thiolase family protein [Nitriliruptoraceae bacterium]
MREAVIVDAVRTPVGRGRPGGALAGWHPADLLAHTLGGIVERIDLDPVCIDDVLIGCVSQVGEQSVNIARSAVLGAGFPVSVPAATIDRQCGSSQQALHFATHAIESGAQDVVIVGGVEVMSRVPLGSSSAGRDPHGTRMRARCADRLVDQGVAAELIAAKWGMTRGEVDEYAARSQQRAVAAADDGRTSSELLTVPIDRGDGPTGEHLGRDEGLRPGTTVASLADLPLAFVDDDVRRRLPNLRGVVHAGNSSQLSDGAAAMVVMAHDVALDRGLQPRARVRATSVVGDDPILMLTGIVPATNRVLERSGIALEDIDVFEVNEAFAPVVLAWLHATGADPDRVNVHGGAIANGHPLGASGAKLVATLLNVLDRVDGRLGLLTMCEGGGMANATIIERL